MSSSPKCVFKHPEWGRCRQPMTKGSLCLFHHHWMYATGEPDSYYHEKIVRGLTVPAGSFLGEEELRAIMGGKYHGDGRRLDAYVLDDPEPAGAP